VRAEGPDIPPRVVNVEAVDVSPRPGPGPHPLTVSSLGTLTRERVSGQEGGCGKRVRVHRRTVS
jgi:hypothetical protein